MAVQAQPYPDTTSGFFFPISDDHHHLLLPCFASNTPPLPNNNNNILLSQTTPSTSTSLHDYLHLQRQELDALLHLQNERMRMALQEQRKQQIAILLKGMEVRATSIVRRKQDDLAHAATKKAELESSLRRAEADKDTWRRLAMHKEAAVVELNRQLELVKERLMEGRAASAVDDAESFAGGEGSGKGGCRRCGDGEACMVFLPCRHLCSCKDCEAFLGACPVCTCIKEGSLEVFWV
ncbi:Probable BOI-related E3 ubiquitin-protein ligase 3 [Linum perenne]